MKVLTAIKEGWSLLLAYRRMWVILYVCNVVFALIAVLPLRSWMKSAAGRSLALTDSFGRFDFVFLTDILRNHPEGFAVVAVQALVITLLYVILSAFLMGGVLQSFLSGERRFDRQVFLNGCSKFFWRLLRLGMYFLLLYVVVLGVICVVWILPAANLLEMENESVLFVRLWTGLPVVGILVICLAIMHTYLKIFIVRDDARPMTRAWRSCMRFMRHQWWQVVGLYMLNMALLGMVMLVYTVLRNGMSSGTMAGLLLTFALGQILLVCRIGVKLLILSSAVCLVKRNVFTSYSSGPGE